MPELSVAVEPSVVIGVLAAVVGIPIPRLRVSSIGRPIARQLRGDWSPKLRRARHFRSGMDAIWMVAQAHAQIARPAASPADLLAGAAQDRHGRAGSGRYSRDRARASARTPPDHIREPVLEPGAGQEVGVPLERDSSGRRGSARCRPCRRNSRRAPRNRRAGRYRRGRSPASGCGTKRLVSSNSKPWLSSSGCCAGFPPLGAGDDRDDRLDQLRLLRRRGAHPGIAPVSATCGKTRPASRARCRQLPVADAGMPAGFGRECTGRRNQASPRSAGRSVAVADRAVEGQLPLRAARHAAHLGAVDARRG